MTSDALTDALFSAVWQLSFIPRKDRRQKFLCRFQHILYAGHIFRIMTFRAGSVFRRTRFSPVTNIKIDFAGGLHFQEEENRILLGRISDIQHHEVSWYFPTCLAGHFSFVNIDRCQATLG